MPARRRRTYGAIYEMALAGAFTLAPFLAFLLADNAYAFRFLALPLFGRETIGQLETVTEGVPALA